MGRQAYGYQAVTARGGVTQDYLGLFDTPPNPREVRLSLAIVGMLVAALLLIVPFGDVQVREIDAFVPAVDMIMFLSDLIIAILLYAQASVFRSRALTVLASVYVFKALLIFLHALTFPGAFAPSGLLGAGVSTTAWIFVIRRAAFPIAVMLYVVLKRADSQRSPATERPAAGIDVGVFAAIALTALAMLAASGSDVLPPLFVNRHDAIITHVDIVGTVTLALDIVAMAVLFRRRHSVLDMWLLVALSGWLVQILLNLTSHDRFTVGFYFEYVLLMFSTLIVMLALITESSRLYVRLVFSVAARDRARETRLMSMDAVAAAIGHEVKQPLSAIVINGSAGLRWLDRNPPNLEMVAKSLRTTVEQGHRASDLITSVRSMVTRRSGERTTFSLNELVRETALLLDRELGSGNISLEFALDGTLPPITADRVQIQEVLINLLTNAIQSLRATQGRPRRIAIRSVALDGPDVLLEASDNGIGITAEQMEQIFDFFFTTKATGTGMGLSLCRIIVEQHGGRLWASQGEGHGAKFHLQIPHSSELAPGDGEQY